MAFRVTRVALQYAKKSTGIVGLPVEPNARQVLVQLYTRILESLKILPEEVEFRKIMTNVTAYRLKTVQQNEDVEKIEDMNDGLQVEQLIEMAKDDLNVIPVYFKYRLWETADYDEFELEDEMAKAFGESATVMDHDHEIFKHDLQNVQREMRTDPLGGVPAEEEVSEHRKRYLNLLRLGLYGEDKMKEMAAEDEAWAAKAAAETGGARA